MTSMEHGDPAYDWVDDGEMSAEETLRRFATLLPQRVGPVADSDQATSRGGASETFTEVLGFEGDRREPLVS
jgi:hypothetical protein